MDRCVADVRYAYYVLSTFAAPLSGVRRRRSQEEEEEEEKKESDGRFRDDE